MSADVATEARRCAAKSKQSGERCRHYPTPGHRVCHIHGSKTPRGAALPQYKHGERSAFVPRDKLPEIIAELATIKEAGPVSVVESNLAERRVRRRHLPDEIAGDLDVSLKLDGADRSDVDVTVRAAALARAAESEGAVTLSVIDLSNPPITTVTGPEGKAARLLAVADLTLIESQPGVWMNAERFDDGSWRPVLALEAHS